MPSNRIQLRRPKVQARRLVGYRAYSAGTTANSAESDYCAPRSSCANGAGRRFGCYGIRKKCGKSLRWIERAGQRTRHNCSTLPNSPSPLSTIRVSIPGTAEGVSLAYKKALAALGADPNAAVPQEAFRKVMATNILNQVADMKASAKEMASGASRIFQSQIELMEKAAQNPDNSIESNRFLTEVIDRTIQQNMTIGDKAADYRPKTANLIRHSRKGCVNTWSKIRCSRSGNYGIRR